MDNLPRQAAADGTYAMQPDTAVQTPAVQTLYVDGMLRIVRRYGSGCLELHGELDVSNVAALSRALAAEAARWGGPPVPGSLHLDLSLLEFLDLSGMRLLARTALALFEDGERRLVLHGLAPQQRRALQAVGWDGTPGLDISHDTPYSLALHHC